MPSSSRHRGAASSLLESFPKGYSPRPEQRRIISEIDEAVNSGYPNIVLCAPTGVGKSHVAASFAASFRTSYILTSTKALQDQYTGDFGFLYPMKGRSNFPCLALYEKMGVRYRRSSPVRRALSCRYGNCTWYGPGGANKCEYAPKKSDFAVGGGKILHEPPNSCHYFAQKFIAGLMPHTVHNYASYFFLRRQSGQSAARDVIVADEAHEIEGKLVSLTACTVKEGHLAEIGMGPSDLRLRDISDLQDTLAQMYGRYRDITKKAGRNDASLAAKVVMMEALRHAHYEACTLPGNVVFERDGPGFEMKLLDVSGVARDLFDGRLNLFMSATIHAEVFCRTMSLDPRDVRFIAVRRSPFPARDRRVVFRGVAALGRRAADADHSAVCDAVSAIMREHETEKGLILTTSKEHCDRIYSGLPGREQRRIILAHSASGTPVSDILRRHAEGARPTVLLSPSLWTGADLKGDRSRFQVIAKAPYLSLADRRTAIKARRNPAWYRYEALMRLLQGLGRSVREPGDHAVTYLLDSQIAKLLSETASYIPKPYRDILRPEEWLQ